MNIVRNYRTWKELFKNKADANNVLGSYIRLEKPQLVEEYSTWSDGLRNICCAAMTAILSNQFCQLEEVPFTDKRRLVSYFVGAAARISDDLTDSKIVKPEEVYLLDKRASNPSLQFSSDQRLFAAFHEGLEGLLPPNFPQDFKNSIRRYNLAQKEGQKLSGDLTREELIKIKDNTGGYPFVFLYNLMFPEKGDITINLMPNYDPNYSSLPKTKAEAIFNLGAMASRGDDLFDVNKDKKEGVKSLATEGIISWRSVDRDFDYVEKGLKRFYPKDIVTEIMQDWRSQAGFIALSLNNYVVPFLNGVRRKLR